GRELLCVARLSEAAADVLGTLDADRAAGTRRAMPCKRMAHGWQRRRAYQAVHRADPGRAHDRLSRARSRLLLLVVQGSARPVPRGRARWFPRSGGRHGESVDDAGLLTPDRLDRTGATQPRSDDQSADEDRARQACLPALRETDRRVALESVLGRDHAGE